MEARNSEEAIQWVRDQPPDVVLLDLDLPDRDGFALLQQLRALCSAGIIVVTSRADEQDKIRGLEFGADDYVTKPFSPGELAARVSAVWRRTSASRPWGAGRLTVDDRLQIDFNEHDIIVAGQRVHLRPTEYRLLSYLVEHEGHILPFENILANVWGPEYHEESHYVHLYVAYLRQKLEADPSRPRHILSQRGVGYGFYVRPPQGAVT
jgi:two-component system, OmpR family, KDP operon response regulator KdpE